MITSVIKMTKDKYSKEDASLDTLLDLDGEIFPMDIGQSLRHPELYQRHKFLMNSGIH